MDTSANPFRLVWPRNNRLQRPISNANQPTASHTPIRTIPAAPPIHLKTTTPLPQSSCPLYDIIPPEIRAQIFDYYFLEYASSLPSDQYQPDTLYYRPGFTAKFLVDTALLQTCRRVYLEAYPLPLKNKSIVFWHSPERAPPPIRDREPFGIDPEKRFFALLQPWQVNLVTEMHLFTQLFWMERGDCFGSLCQQDFMQNLRKLKITIRRGDWWWNETNVKLCMNPVTGNGQNVFQMENCIAKQARGEYEPFEKGSWARFFSHLKALELLEYEFETSEEKQGELEGILKWAKTWEFPMGERGVLKAGEKVGESEWRADVSAWNEQCPYCQWMGNCGRRAAIGQDVDTRCQEKLRLVAMRMGPMFIVRNMSWYLTKG